MIQFNRTSPRSHGEQSPTTIAVGKYVASVIVTSRHPVFSSLPHNIEREKNRNRIASELLRFSLSPFRQSTMLRLDAFDNGKC